MLDDDGETVLIDQPEAIRGLENSAGLAWDHHIPSQPGETADFKAGSAAMGHGWVSEAINLANAVDFKMDIVLCPAGPKGYFHRDPP